MDPTTSVGGWEVGPAVDDLTPDQRRLVLALFDEPGTERSPLFWGLHALTLAANVDHVYTSARLHVDNTQRT
jgi:hypothetical protein